MKKYFIVLLAALLICACMTPASAATITAQGSAQIAAKPDMFSIVSNISITAPTVPEAREQVAGVIADATQKLAALGVHEDDIVTQDFSYYPQYDYSPDYDDGPRMIGYQVNHALNVTCRDLDLLDSVINTLTEGGMTEAWNVSFDVSSRAELYRQALALAIDAARVKAEAMAIAGGLSLSGIQSVEEHASGDVYRYAASDKAVMMAESGAGNGIRSGEVTVSAGVTVVYSAQE